MPRSQLLEFWRQPAPEGNEPEGYFSDPNERSKRLAELLSDFPKDSRILEVGCNVGRNLAYLTDIGYQRVEGLEISPHAVKLLREHYPQLAHAPVHLGAAEEVLPSLEGPYDVVFTMAVLEHIHPDSAVVFDEIARLGRTVLAIEPAPWEPHASSRQFPHDLSSVFGARGMKQVSFEKLSSGKPVADEDVHFYAVWRFEHA